MMFRKTALFALLMFLTASTIGAWPNCDACVTADDGSKMCLNGDNAQPQWPRYSPCGADIYCDGGYFCYWRCTGSMCYIV